MTTERLKRFEGRKVIYICDDCKGHIVTVDADRGVTPFKVECHATEGCEGVMKPHLAPDQEMRPDHSWHREDLPHLRKIEQATGDKS